MTYLEQLHLERKERLRRLNGCPIIAPPQIPPPSPIVYTVPALAAELGSEFEHRFRRKSHENNIRKIVHKVADVFKVSALDILSERRTATVVRPRQVVFWIARTYSTKSFPEIGRAIGGRDHTTALYGYRKINSTIPQDGKLKSKIAEVVSALGLGGEIL